MLVFESGHGKAISIAGTDQAFDNQLLQRIYTCWLLGSHRVKYEHRLLKFDLSNPESHSVICLMHRLVFKICTVYHAPVIGRMMRGIKFYPCPSAHLCPAHNSLTVWNIFMKLHRWLNHIETMCREQSRQLRLSGPP